MSRVLKFGRSVPFRESAFRKQTLDRNECGRRSRLRKQLMLHLLDLGGFVLDTDKPLDNTACGCGCKSDQEILLGAIIYFDRIRTIVE
jgi:hypothetical protein